jgi:hypothetical protein
VERLLVSAVLLFLGVFSVTNGVLMLTSPRLFLRFHELLNRGDYAAKTGSWRKDVDKREFKLAGLGLLFLGAIPVWIVLFKIL